MPKLAKPTWFYILEAAKEFKGKPFNTTDIINKIKEKYPRAKRDTIRVNIYGMAHNHPSSRHYQSLKKHAAFTYQGNGQFQMLEQIDATKTE